MRLQAILPSALTILAALALSANASATTSNDALAMPLGSWPSHLACLLDTNGNMTGYREEEILVTDAPDQGNVLSRPFPDPTCHS
jgi:hypothetical protein